MERDHLEDLCSRWEDNINTIGNVRTTLDVGVFVRPLLPWKSITLYIF